MHGDYSEGRRTQLHLRWRYERRAIEAVAAYRRIGTPRESHRVLDLGAADGLTLLEIRNLLGGRGTFDGVELSDSLMVQSAPLPSDTRLLKGDVMRLPTSLEPTSYDLVTALAVLEHLPDPESCVREARRMLKPGGVFVATCPNPLWDRAAGTLGLVADEHHEQQMTRHRLVDLLRNGGFEFVSYRPFMWAPVAALPYGGVYVPMNITSLVDSVARGARILDFTFVNQLVCGRRGAP
jgi:ubiquinone/menaquinone biosynthesis C-methylase UbiE